MEHQVIVPFPVRRVWSALLEADRLGRCVPGFLPDVESPQAAEGAGRARRAAGPARLRGRLRLRIAGSTITYRGELRVAPEESTDNGEVLAVTGEAEEARGSGTAKVTLRVQLSPAEDAGWATSVSLLGSVRAGGRLAENSEEAMAGAGQRLVDRFLTALVEELAAEEAEAERARGDAAGGPSDAELADELEGFADDIESDDRVPEGIETDDAAFLEVPDSPAGLEENLDLPPFERDVHAELREQGMADAAGRADGRDGDEDDEDEDDLDLPFPSEEFFESGEAPDPDEMAAGLSLGAAEEKDGRSGRRRTMVGRSAEEVDHAPPRGRYAPVPVPVPPAPRRDWRLAAAGAAAAVAATVVVYRVVRSRR